MSDADALLSQHAKITIENNNIEVLQRRIDEAFMELRRDRSKFRQALDQAQTEIDQQKQIVAELSEKLKSQKKSVTRAIEYQQKTFMALESYLSDPQWRPGGLFSIARAFRHRSAWLSAQGHPIPGGSDLFTLEVAAIRSVRLISGIKTRFCLKHRNFQGRMKALSQRLKNLRHFVPNNRLEFATKLAEIVEDVWGLAVEMHEQKVVGRLVLPSLKLSKLRTFRKKAVNALIKIRSKIALAQKMSEQRSPWPDSVNVFPTELCKQTAEKQLDNELQEFLSSSQVIQFKPYSKPLVSIIIAVYNKPQFLLRCLKSVAENTDVPYEVIIWDDNSSEPMDDLYTKVHGANLIRSAKNVNYVLANNEAAKQARGDFILLLNSDAAIRQNAVSSSASLLERYSTIGVVGGKLLLPDGKVQETGNVVWSDGSCAGIGRGLSAQDSRTLSCRIVDYCSGAFFMTRRSLWNSIGGFDTNFAPAYYEETDYCLRIRHAGWLTVYNPDALIDHYEFATTGNRAATQLMQTNQTRLVRAHEDDLKLHPAPNDWHGYFFQSLKERKRQRWLFIDDQFPQVTSGAGFPRARRILQTLSAEINREVWMLPTNIETTTESPGTRDDDLKWVHVFDCNSSNQVLDILRSEIKHFDVVFVSRPHNKQLLDNAVPWLNSNSPGRGPVIIYDAEAIFQEREIIKHFITTQQQLPEAEQQARVSAELNLAKSAGAIVTVSHKDAKKYSGRLPEKPVFVLSYYKKWNVTSSTFQQRNGMLFVGPMLHRDTPNYDGIQWLCSDVFPLMKQQEQHIPLTLVGQINARAPFNFDGYPVNVLGVVKTLNEVFERARVFVCPTRYAAGISTKAIESMAAGVPLICTPVIADQLSLVHEKHALIASTAEEFAEATYRLHEDETLWQSIRDQALHFVERNHSMEIFQSTVHDLFSEVASRLMDVSKADQHYELKQNQNTLV